MSTEVRKDEGATNVELYLLAKVNGDIATIRDLLCNEMEKEWEREAHSFDSVSGLIVKDLSCNRRGNLDIVDCQGEIHAVYAGEQRVFPLSTYKIVYENGTWRWCGEAP